MKRLLSILLAAVMLLALSACSLKKISEIELPPRPGTEDTKKADATPSAETKKPDDSEKATPAKAYDKPSPETEKTEQEIPEEQETDFEKPTASAESEPLPVAISETTGKNPAEDLPKTQDEPFDNKTDVHPATESAPPAVQKPAEPVSVQAPAVPPVISIYNETRPTDIACYKSVNLHGVIETEHGVITQVYAVIMNERGDPVQDCAYYPNTQRFNLADTVNYCLRFGSLDPGSYVYQLNASAVNGEITVSSTLTEVSFHVSAPFQTQTEAPSGTESGTETPLDPSQYSAKQTGDSSNAGQIWNYLIAQLNNPFAAAGILGNIQAESSCLPYAVENDTSKGRSFSKSYTESADNGTITRESFAYSPPGDSLGYGFGLCQWSMDRKGNLYDYAKSNGVSLNSVDTQCTFLMQELSKDYPSLLEYLKICTDPREACRRFCTDFEKAAVWGARIDYAVEYLEMYAKN